MKLVCLELNKFSLCRLLCFGSSLANWLNRDRHPARRLSQVIATDKLGEKMLRQKVENK